ncbi:MAG: ABC transporter substrate-binding protein, partial [Planctomycetota bacterium]
MVRGENDTDLRVRLLLFPDREYDISWRDIADIKTFEQVVLEEGQRLLTEGDLDDAYLHFVALHRMGEQAGGLSRPLAQALDRSLVQLLRAQVAEAFRGGRLVEALALLAEIERKSPGGRGTARGMARIVQQLFDERFAQGDFEAARGFVQWASTGTDQLQLSEWAQRAQAQLEAYATERVGEARQAFASGDYRMAREKIQAALDAVPGSTAALELNREIDTRFPGIVVGVTRAADPNQLSAQHDWAARRVARLMQRDLVEILDYGPDGARYHCPYGEVTVESDNQGVLISIDPPDQPGRPALSGYDVAQMLLSSREHNVSGDGALRSDLLAAVSVDDVFRVQVDLQSPLLQPLGLLTLPLDEHARALSSYEWIAGDARSNEFRRRNDEGGEAMELTERHFDSIPAALAAMRRGEVQVIDRLSPLMAAKAERDLGATKVRYRFPSQHFLIPNQERPLMRQRGARRAIAYAIAREAILQQDLLGGQPVEGCGVLSGPFTIGSSPDDPVAYAQNEEVPVRAYDPSLAITLYAVAQQQVADETGEASDPDDWEPLKLVYPDDAAIESMVKTIVRYLTAAGIECVIEPLPPGGGRPEGDWDLWYV